MTVSRVFLKNGIAATLQKLLRVLDQLLLVPFFITAWGAAYYGEWLTLMVIPTVLSFSDMGFGTAAANAFVLKYAGGDRQGAADIAKSSFLTIGCIVFSSIAISCLVVYFGAEFGIFEGSLIDKKTAAFVVLIMMAARIVAFYQQFYEAYFKAARRIDASMNLQTGYSLVNLLASIAVLSRGGGIVEFSLITLLLSILFTFLYVYCAKKILPIENECIGVINYSDIRELIKKGFGYLMAPVWQAIFFQGTTIAVRVTLGPVAVTTFNTVRTVTRAVNQVYSIVINATLSELQYEIGRGQMERARKIFRMNIAIVCAIAVIGIIFLALFGEVFYAAWTKNELSPPSLMWNIFIFGIIFNAIWWPASYVFPAMNLPYEFAVGSVFCAFCSVAITYVLASIYGVTGAAIGNVCMDILLAAYVLPKSCSLIGQSIGSLFGDAVSDIKLISKKLKI